MTDKIIITLTGPSLTGKSTLEQLLASNGCSSLTSSTTRAPREGEVNGKHYHFLTKEQFKAGVAAKEFIEHVEFDGNFYGMSKREAEKAFATGKPAVLVCEPQGAKLVKAYAIEQGWRPFQVFVDNPQELLIQRFLERFKTDAKATSERYAARLLSMMTVERKEWVEPAYSGEAGYDLVLESFVPETQAQAVDAVLKGIKASPRSARRCGT